MRSLDLSEVANKLAVNTNAISPGKNTLHHSFALADVCSGSEWQMCIQVHIF